MSGRSVRGDECAFPSCSRKVKARGHCNGHYQQVKAGKELKPLQRKIGADGRVLGEGICFFIDCLLPLSSWGLCDGHYQQQRAGHALQSLQVIRDTCTIEGCGRPHEAQGYCTKHYERKRAGKDPLTPSRKDPSLVEEVNGVLHVELGGEKASGAATLVSLEDRALVEYRSWWMNVGGYAEGKIEGQKVLLHRLLLDCPSELQVDHINGKRLDNQRENLRIVTFAEQMQNKKPWGESGHRNVHRRRCGGWRVIVTKDGVRHNGGNFKDVALAVAAAAELRGKLFTHHVEDRSSLDP